MCDCLRVQGDGIVFLRLALDLLFYFVLFCCLSSIFYSFLLFPFLFFFFSWTVFPPRFSYVFTRTPAFVHGYDSFGFDLLFHGS